jgi:hypothetical protein
MILHITLAQRQKLASDTVSAIQVTSRMRSM